MDYVVYMAHITQHRIKIQPVAFYAAYRDAGISRDEMARRMGVSTGTAYRIESGRVDPSPSFIAALMIFTGKPFSDLFTIETVEAVA